MGVENMANKGQHTFTEISTQPDAWADAIHFLESNAHALKKAWQVLAPKQVLFIGCGSTYYLSQSAAALFQQLTGVRATACPSSQLLLFAPQVMTDPAQTLLIAISRSGTTTETLTAVGQFRRLGGMAVWGISCYPQQTLAQEVDLVLLAEAAQEKSIAQTRSFASMLVLVQGLAAIAAGEDLGPLSALPDLGRDLIKKADPLAQQLGSRSDLERFYFLGSGVQYGLANEAMLKMKEMSLTISEGFHFLEFRHGPISMVNEQTLVIGLLSRRAHIHEQKLLVEVTQLGAETLPLLPAPSEIESAYDIYLDPAIPSWALPVLYLPPLQLLAYYRSVGKGLDPDNPRHLNAVVFLDASDFLDQ